MFKNHFKGYIMRKNKNIQTFKLSDDDIQILLDICKEKYTPKNIYYDFLKSIEKFLVSIPKNFPKMTLNQISKVIQENFTNNDGTKIQVPLYVLRNFYEKELNIKFSVRKRAKRNEKISKDSKNEKINERTEQEANLFNQGVNNE